MIDFSGKGASITGLGAFPLGVAILNACNRQQPLICAVEISVVTHLRLRLSKPVATTRRFLFPISSSSVIGLRLSTVSQECPDLFSVTLWG